MGLSLKKITGSEGLNLGSAVRGITENPLLAGLAGLALAPMTAGTSLAFLGATPLASAMTVGGIGALASGSLGKGLQAGLAAYGGASLGAGLGRTGALLGQEAALANTPMTATNEQLVSELSKASAPTQSMLAGASQPAKVLADLGGGSALKGAGMVGLPLLAAGALSAPKTQMPEFAQAPGMIRPYEFTRTSLAPQPGQMPTAQFGSAPIAPQYQPGQDTSERRWFQDTWTPLTPYKAPGSEYTENKASGGPIEQMSDAVSVGANTGFPMADIQRGGYATPWQTPVSRNVVADESDTGVDSFTGAPRGMAAGGLGSLGGYSDGGRMLKGPGDGMSDDIPATIGGKRPARLADGEFVVPADVVSHLGNGSTDAGARQLYKMMDRVRQQRTGKKKQAPEVNPRRAMPA